MLEWKEKCLLKRQMHNMWHSQTSLSQDLMVNAKLVKPAQDTTLYEQLQVKKATACRD